MKIQRREEDGVVVLRLAGDLYGGSETLAIVETLERMGIEGQLDAILDLSRVRHIASNGFGILVRARRTYARYGGMFVLCGANSRVMSLLEVTRLNLIFDVRKDCREAREAIAETAF